MNDKSGAPSGGFRPRPEAGPFTWNALTEDQRKVVEDIYEWLIAYLDTTPEPKDSSTTTPFGWSIDQYRPSNVLLIDGGRGSGKTSVLLSLLDLWNKCLDTNLDEALPGWEPIKNHLERGKGRLVPVPVLDLQPLPPSTSLRTWIAGRLLQLAETSTARAEATRGIKPRGRPTLFASAEEEPGWSVAWRNLLQDAAAGWPPESGPNRRRLDPESFAVELEQAELARLTIVDHWRKFVDEVAFSVSDSQAGVEPDARIIIPIDDADMNPARCVELLEILRTLWHPRVVFLLTGHSSLFLKTLSLHFLGVFQAQLGGPTGSELGRPIVEAEPTAVELAVQTYDKVLPTYQRFELSALTPNERLRLLANVLDVPIRRPDAQPRPETLREYFDLNPYARPVLPERLRKIQNLRQVWNHLQAQGRHAAATVHALWRDAFIDERYHLPSEDARSIESMVGLDGERIQIRDMEWRFQRLTSRTKHFQFQEESHLLRFAEAAGFAFPISVAERTLYLPDRLTSALLLAVDIFIEERDERFDLLSPMPAGFDHDLVRNELTFLSGPSSNIGAPFNQSPAATWPLPDWRTSLDFAIFDEHWNKALRSQPGAQEQRIGSIAHAFLWAVLAAYKRDPRMKLPRMGDPSAWDVLARELVDTTRSLAHQNKRTERDEAFLNWLLGRAILLAAPESGLPPDFANMLLRTWLDHLEHEDAQLRERALQSARAERQWQATRINRRSGSIAEFLVDLDSRFPQYNWARKVEPHGKTKGPSLQELIGSDLSNFYVNHKNPERFEPRDLRGYMDKLQLDIPTTPYFTKRASDALKQLRHTKSSTEQALVWLWKNLVDEFNPGKPEMKRWLALTDSREELAPQLPDSLQRRLESYEHTQSKHTLAVPIGTSGIELRLYELGSPVPLDELYQFLILAHDVLWDINNRAPDWLSQSKPSAYWFGVLPHAETGIRYEGKDVRIGWPTPRWATFLDWRLEDHSLTESLFPARTVLQLDEEHQHPRRVLAACLHVALSVSLGIGERRSADPSFDIYGQDLESWFHTGERIRRIIDPPSSKHSNKELLSQDNRFVLVQDWARLAAPLYATPEMGLPPNCAKGLLAGWMGAPRPLPGEHPLQSMSDELGNQCRRLRRLWVARCFENSKLPNTMTEVQRFLREIDSQNADHPWHQVFGAEADTEPSEES